MSALPDIRLAIRKDGNRWTVTTIKGAYSNQYSVSHAWEITYPGGLLEELLGKGCCHLCGAPLWDVNGHVCCSQHWGHYPQPASVVCRYESTRVRSSRGGWRDEKGEYIPHVQTWPARTISYTTLAALCSAP